MISVSVRAYYPLSLRERVRVRASLSMLGSSFLSTPSPRPFPGGRGRKLTIVVGGYIIGYPLGGMTWHHLNYLLGLADLGHEVWFLEDSGSYAIPYDPAKRTCSPDSSYGRAYLERTFATF